MCVCFFAVHCIILVLSFSISLTQCLSIFLSFRLPPPPTPKSLYLSLSVYLSRPYARSPSYSFLLFSRLDPHILHTLHIMMTRCRPSRRWRPCLSKLLDTCLENLSFLSLSLLQDCLSFCLFYIHPCCKTVYHFVFSIFILAARLSIILSFLYSSLLQDCLSFCLFYLYPCCKTVYHFVFSIFILAARLSIILSFLYSSLLQDCLSFCLFYIHPCCNTVYHFVFSIFILAARLSIILSLCLLPPLLHSSLFVVIRCFKPSLLFTIVTNENIPWSPCPIGQRPQVIRFFLDSCVCLPSVSAQVLSPSHTYTPKKVLWKTAGLFSLWPLTYFFS